MTYTTEEAVDDAVYPKKVLINPQCVSEAPVCVIVDRGDPALPACVAGSWMTPKELRYMRKVLKKALRPVE